MPISPRIVRTIQMDPTLDLILLAWKPGQTKSPLVSSLTERRSPNGVPAVTVLFTRRKGGRNMTVSSARSQLTFVTAGSRAVNFLGDHQLNPCCRV